ncbi:LamG-like jellyroll fold domain-containing protein [Streptomyces sp. DSM 44915]|uniref:LamG-like jellyroll fold domain-containing protein n=1 Tax=Streptomyces chisholmiae TaxID=3075540 RepID=A0ABU2JIJ3_9ACTN|nr:LamG-like jellyroll fold domain-containing protein [Streptomyces sp. DSM 44915]MDT0264811.1 LamG-like jellyroll fold domain-containing protein [Streptomyces sp. DSM 44915]
MRLGGGGSRLTRPSRLAWFARTARAPGRARHGRRRSRRAVVVAAALALGAGLLGPGGVTGGAGAVTPPLTMTAEDLPTWQTNGIVHALAEADGVVYAGGSFTTVRPPGAEPDTQEQPAVNFVALDAATGEPLADCALAFTVGSGNATIRALAVSPDGGTLYAGGTFGSVAGAGASSLAAFELPGCARKPFPVAANGIVRALAATDETVYVGGDFTQLSGTPRAKFGAVDTAGQLLDWRADADEAGKAIALTPDGEHVLLGGDFFTVNGADSHALAVVEADSGALTRGYPEGFIDTRSTVQDLAVDETGFYTGNEGTGAFDGRIALELDTFDERWRDTCLGATQAVEVHRDVLYSGHHAHDCSSMGEFPNQERYHLFGQGVDDPALLGWFPNTNDGLGERLGPRTLAVVEDHPADDRDFLWVGGGFTTVNGQPQWGLTRFTTEPDTGAPTAPEAHAASPADGVVELSWRSSLDLDDSLLTYRVYRDGAATPVHTVDGSSLPWRRPQLRYTDEDTAPGETHSYRITATDAAGNTSALSTPVSVTTASGGQPYADAVLADEPLLYWRYDESAGNFVSDASGNDSAGVHRGGPQRGVTPPAVPGPAAAGVGYDGVDDYTYGDVRYGGMSEFTLETWFNTTTSRGGKLIGLGDRTLQPSANRDNNIYLLNDGRVAFGVYDGRYHTVTSRESYNDGQWHQVAASVGPAGMRLYVDGEQVAVNTSITASREVNGYWRTGGDSLQSWPGRPSSDFYQGRLDETAVYAPQLPAARIAAHYAAAALPVDTVTQLTPDADTYVNGAAVNAIHGTHQQLAVRGSSRYESYLAFTLPAAPPGTVLKDAALRVRVSDDAAAGSLDDFAVRATVGDWSEATTTYANRPELAEESLGTLAAPEAPGGSYTARLEVGEIADALGGELGLALTGEGTDSLWLRARESGQVAARPQLLLTFGAP